MPTDRCPYVEFGNSDKVRVGDAVIAIGNPFGLGDTVTAGIVSAEHRTIGAGRYDDFLQIDAPINRGNSGGPTFNLAGQVIGINTAIHSPTGGSVGIGFAIPSDQAKMIIDQLNEGGKVERGWLGVHIQSLDEDLAKSLGLDEDKGALVAEVTPDSPAASAGFKQGDVVLSYGGHQIEQLRDLTSAVADTKAGANMNVVVWRDGGKKTLEVEIGQMPGEEQMAALTGEQQPQESNTPKLGVMLGQLTPEARQQFQLSEDVKGVVVTEVEPGSPAAEKGLQPGDVIIEADRKQVSDPKAVADAVREAAKSERPDDPAAGPARGSEPLRCDRARARLTPGALGAAAAHGREAERAGGVCRRPSLLPNSPRSSRHASTLDRHCSAAMPICQRWPC